MLTKRLKEGTSFIFAKVDIKIHEPLWPKFEEMLPFVYNKEVLDEAVPKHMLDYLQHTGRKRGDRKRLVGASAQKLLLYALLLGWYVYHGAQIKAVCRTTMRQQKSSLGLWSR